MQLSLIYDVLYTKAAVIHTWYGFCIRIVSVLGTATTFLLFHLHLTRSSGRGGNNNNEYNRRDVIVSYVLLVGALVLEAISLFKAPPGHVHSCTAISIATGDDTVPSIFLASVCSQHAADCGRAPLGSTTCSTCAPMTVTSLEAGWPRRWG